jgi:hypothetical protein
VGFFLGYRFLNPKGLAYGLLWSTRHHPMIKMLLKAVLKKVFAQFKIRNNFKQNIDEMMKYMQKSQKSIGKSKPE